MSETSDQDFNPKKYQKDVQIRVGFEQWKRQQKREELLAKGENPDDYTMDDLPNQDDGVNTRNGFPQYKPVMKHNKNLLSKKNQHQIGSNAKSVTV